MAANWRKYDTYNWQEFGAWVRESRGVAGWSLDTLARKVGIGSRGTLKHVEDGARGLPPERRKLLANVFADAAHARGEQIDRRKFLLLAGLTAGASITSPADSQPSPVLVPRQKIQGIDELEELIFDLGVGVTEARDTLFSHGDGQLVLKQATRRYRMLRESHYVDKKDIALTAARIGIHLGRAVEAVTNWFDRPSAVISVYNDVEARILAPTLAHFPKDAGVQFEYARLVGLRAPLYRELRQYPESFTDFDNAIKFAKAANEAILQASLQLNRAHTIAALGHEDAWRAAHEPLEGIIGSAPSRARSPLSAFALYHRGEGFKRLAYNPRVQLSEKKRAEIAALGFRDLRQSRDDLGGDWRGIAIASTVGGHPFVSRVSEAQCQVWTCPEQAVEELNALRIEAEVEYPSLRGKIDFAPWCADQRLKRSRNEPLPIFDLDAKYTR